ncbi:MAG: PfkB family carbohydrate kinase [Crenarchaeota archaeon]|nr:PfkB family carbohydrate kinase [Thermoproteota archaeon]
MSRRPLRIGVIGALTIDVNVSRGGSYSYMGGGGFYSSLSLSRIGVETVLFTAYGPDMNPEWVESLKRKGVKVYATELDRSILFENVYQGNSRLQKTSGEPSRKIVVERSKLSAFDAIHVTPVLNEVDHRVFKELEEAGCKVSIDAQGFIRASGVDGRVQHVKRMLSEDALSRINYVHMNVDEQFFFLNSDVKELFEINPKMIVELTNSEHGSMVVYKQGCFYMPVFNVETLDPTGAGDVYAAVFLAKHLETGSLVESSLYASACSSIKAEKTGPFFDFSVNEIEDRVRELKRLIENLY